MVKAALAFACLRLIEQFAIDNREFWHVGRLPLLFRIRARDAAARVRILHHAHLVPDQPATIEFVLQDAGAALQIAVDCRSVPFRTARRWNVVAVEVTRNITRSAPGDILIEDTTDDLGLFFDNLPLPRLTRNRSIAVCQATGVEALTDASGLAAANLVRVVFTIELTDQPPKTDENRIGDTIVDSADFNVEKGQALGRTP